VTGRRRTGRDQISLGASVVVWKDMDVRAEEEWSGGGRGIINLIQMLIPPPKLISAELV
jgi:hypothetical protein